MPSSFSSPSDQRLLVVHEIHRRPGPIATYVDQVVGDGEQGIDFRFATGRPRAGRGDVIHLHSLETLFGRRNAHGVRRLAVAVTFAASVARRRIALVRTLDGSDKGAGRAHRLSRAIIDRVVTTYVSVDGIARAPRSRPVTVIPHGHYRDRYLGYPRGEQVPGRLLCLSPGHLGRSVVGALKVFAVTNTPGLSLRVVGRATQPIATVVDDAVARTPETVSAHVDRISDGRMVQEASSAELVLVPSAGDVDDLAVLFLALSLERPVLMAEGPLARAIGAAVGEKWIRTYRGPLTAVALDEAFEAVRSDPPLGSPDLDGRGWDAIGAAYADVFRAAAAKVARR